MSDETEPLLTPRERDFLARNPSAEIVDSQTNPAAKPALEGVEGWLGFLAISLVFLGPVITLAMTAFAISDLKSSYASAVDTTQFRSLEAAVWVATLAYCAISIFAGYRLFKHRVPSTIPIVIVCMWIAGPLIGILAMTLFEGDVSAGSDLARSFITTGGWTAYLLLSKRVKNTYRSPAPDPSLVETFR
jgi:hypothetical protein